ncbi:hypothetical protein FHW69_003304 [Luteibacter sp. Sphag1AF]|uniref:hypothetical protein n=1 Tax=Luteibacter sp. Sphag1AF TaxID=2587031 RepID=UPI00160ED4FD|nr:hypothetical protein [Luteibacter sp. Sphag1AF]MBB3228662.1 hypothetical protein [Luteibacter sp. Sphag1AF]
MNRQRFRVKEKILLTMSFILVAGCHGAISIHEHAGKSGPFKKNTFPLTFSGHNFSAYCFNTWGCKVIYDDMYDVRDRDDVLSSPFMGPDHLQRLNAVRISIENFPPPAIVTWRSRDGVPHEDAIDLDRIFRDRRIVHKIDEKKISDTAFIGNPDILLIVDDRTLSIYMKTYLPLKKLRDPANRYSGMSESFVRIYAKTY